MNHFALLCVLLGSLVSFIFAPQDMHESQTEMRQEVALEEAHEYLAREKRSQEMTKNPSQEESARG